MVRVRFIIRVILGVNVGKGSRRRAALISEEEHVLRYAYQRGEIRMTEAEFNKRIAEIRGRTRRP